MLNRASGTIPVTNSVRSRFPGYPDRAAVHRSTSPLVAALRFASWKSSLRETYFQFPGISTTFFEPEGHRELYSRRRKTERERERGEVYADRKLFYFSFSLDERTNERTPFLSDFDSCPSCFAFPPAGTRSTGQLVIPLHAGETSPKRDHSQSISVILLIVPAMSPSGRNEFNGLDRANRRRRRLSLTLPLPLSWGLWLWAMTRSSGLNAIAFWFSRIHPFPLHKSRR